MYAKVRPSGDQLRLTPSERPSAGPPEGEWRDPAARRWFTNARYLNDLSGTPMPAPECLLLAPGDFIPPGGSHSDTPSGAGTENYQCCIHPWMRAVVSIRGR